VLLSAVAGADVLLVQPGTTAGWRRGDRELAQALERLGVAVETCTTEFAIARHARRGVVATDLAEAAAMRRALTKALRRGRPRAIIYSSPQAAMLQPRGRLAGATAVRFDAPAALNRRGPGTGLLRSLERRALGAVRLLLPIALEPHESVREALSVDTPMVALPIPVDLPTIAPAAERERLALAYAGNPEKKGLEILASAWGNAAPSGWRLVVTGIEQAEGRRFLRGRGVDEPAGIEWAGMVDPDRYATLLASAELLIAASRYEDYGLAQLEALAAGCLLVTVPSRGPYEALAIANALEPALVAREVGAEGLADALRAALALSEQARESYRARAREQLRPYGRETVDRRLRDEVLPVLLG
jgi:glycosyltransferase involved in cell wall biosynthesis